MPNIRELSPELAKAAVDECKEPSPDRIDSDLKALREWLVMNPHLNARSDDQFLVYFLRGCKYSLEKVKEKLDTYYTVRSVIPELTEYRDPKNAKMEELLKLGIVIPLPQPENDSHPRMVMFRTGLYDPSRFTLNELLAYSAMCGEYAIHNDEKTTVCGQIVIFDLGQLTMQHIAEYTPQAIKRIMVMFQDAPPVRSKGLHYINASPAMTTVFNVTKSMFSEKMRSRFFVHKSLEELYDAIPNIKQYLPTEYGGDGGPEADLIKNFHEAILGFRESYIDDNKYGVDEKKRQTKSRVLECFESVEGSFRQLSVD